VVKIPNRDYRFTRMMNKAVISCAPPNEYQNVGIVCLPSEKRTVYDKVIHYLETEPRPMSLSAPDYIGTQNGTFLIYRNTNSSISLLSEPEDFHMRTFESICIVCNVHEMKEPVRRCLGSAVLSARVNVHLGNSETYNWK